MAYRVDENGNYVRTVRCGHCYEMGHNASGCKKKVSDRAEAIADYEKQLAEDDFADDWYRGYAERNLKRLKEEARAKETGKTRKCSYCLEPGHNRTTCTVRKKDISVYASKIKAIREALKPRIEDAGIGVGALVSFDESGYGSNVPSLAIYTVVAIDWACIGDDHIPNKYGSTGARPIKLRGFPSSQFPNGRVCNLPLPHDVANINDEDTNGWNRQKWEIVSSAPTVSLPSNFLDLEACKKTASEDEKFDGARHWDFSGTD